MNDLTNESVLGFVFDRTNAFVLLQKSLHPGFMGRWNGVGGKLKHEEKPLDAMKRESEEEIGFVPVNGWDYKFAFVCPGDEVHVFKTETSLRIMTSFTPSEQQTRVCAIRRLPIKGAPNLGWLISLCLEPVGQVKSVEDNDP